MNNVDVTEVLRHWKRWRIGLKTEPKLLSPLHGGQTNQSFLLAGDGKRMVLRLNAPNSEKLGINRHHEAVILQHVSEAGIAPTVYHCDPDAGLLLTEYIEGQPLDCHHLDGLHRLHSLLEQVHQLQPPLPVFDYVAHAEKYWHQLNKQAEIDHTLPDKEHLHAELEKLQSVSGQGLCHHDLTPGNVIDKGGKLYLLDWEYAGLGALDYDRAAIRAEWPGFCVSRNGDETQCAAGVVYASLAQLWQAVKTL